ncbi:hypothetical protein QFZ24_009768 [Streptomyces phaeochromogenes]|nr:hypothetical protein [Streptomyces phaeochromogenes]
MDGLQVGTTLSGIPCRPRAELGQGDFWRVADEQMDEIAFAVELPHLGTEAPAHAPHALLAADRHPTAADAAPALRGEHQRCLQVADDMVSPLHPGIRRPARWHTPGHMLQPDALELLRSRNPQ